MMLTDVEREHLFLLGLGRPPEVRYRPPEGVTPRLQRLLDTLVLSPALVRTATWDVVAWNRAAAAVLTDYSSLAAAQRNILRLIFCDPRVRTAQRTGKASRGLWWRHFEPTLRAPAPQRMFRPWLKNCVR